MAAASCHANKLIPFPSPIVGWVKIRNNVITSRHNEDLAYEGNFCKCLNTTCLQRARRQNVTFTRFLSGVKPGFNTRKMRYAITELRLTAHRSKDCILGEIKEFNFGDLFLSLFRKIGW